MSDGHADNNKIIGNKIINKLALGYKGIMLSVTDYTPYLGHLENEVIKGNTITHFATALDTTTECSPPRCAGVFGPNKIKP
jgi:hypothetical protein